MICRKICKHLWSLSYIMTIIRGFYFFSQSSFVSISVSPHPLALSAALLFVTIGLQIRLTTTANTNNCRSLVCYGTCTRGNRVVVEQVVTRYSLRPHSRTQWKLLLIVSKYYSDIRQSRLLQYEETADKQLECHDCASCNNQLPYSGLPYYAQWLCRIFSPRNIILNPTILPSDVR